ncbi:MAG TPA: carbohydrate kinase family protein [Acidobacteriaceae bacterium]|jgi:sugar/nucleoside kinase (ribokinase family)|nr:carbohydrate kinase family protein [Acidobacteriaceae bacterium]
MAIHYGMNKQWDVAVAGEIFADHVFSGFERWPEPGEEHFTDSYVREAGGGAAITSCALARLGRSVALFGIAGEEDLWLMRRLHGFGVQSDGLRTTRTATAVSVSISTRSDRSFLTWPGANRDLPAYLRELKTQDRLATARHVHLAMPVDRELALELIPRLRRAGCTISLDTGHQPEWLEDQENRKTCGEVDFFMPNELEGQMMTGAADPAAMLAGFRAMGICGVVLKLGPEGAIAPCSREGICRGVAPAVTAVDSTGAGDAFDAGLIDAWLDRLPMSTMLRRACVCGSLSTRSAGALTSLPDREELNSYDVPTR